VIFSGGDPSEQLTAYAGFEGDTMHGTGNMSMPLLDNLDKASVYVAVPPSRRRRGIGAAMLGDLVDLAAGAGRTTILRGHRGHRLGLAVKAANLAALQADHPERLWVSTQNAETNAPMVAINERMGFRAVEVLLEFQQVVPPPSPHAAAQTGTENPS
jgi:GNAT superfamily N-acetyltransferase